MRKHFLLVLVVVTVNTIIFSQIRFKVRSESFDWKVYATERYDIHYYDEVAPVIEEVAKVLEDTAKEYENRLSITLKNRIPVIIYANTSHFAQTNIIDSLIDENVGGFSELMKRRLVMPFNGDMQAFRLILRHELIHIFQYEFLFPESTLIAGIYANIIMPPLWLIEGMAEYFSGNIQTEGMMMLRESVLSDSVIQIAMEDDYVFSRYGYYSYKLSQSFLTFLALRFGEKKIIQYFKVIGRSFKRDIRDEFKRIFGVSITHASELWLEELKKTYWIEAATKESPYDAFSVIHFLDNERISLFMPVLSPAGEIVAAYSNHNYEGNIVLLNATTGELLKNLTTGYQDRRYEYVKISPSNLAWYPDGDSLFFVVRDNGVDVITRISVFNGDIVKYPLPGISSIRSLAVSEDGKYVVIAAVKGLYTDLFRFDLQTQALTQLTDDVYHETSVAITKNTIYFLTLREYGDEIRMLPLEGGQSEFLYRNDAIASLNASEGKVYFDRAFGHAYYVCMLDPASGKVYQLTETFNSTRYPNVHNSELMFTMVRNNKYILGRKTIKKDEMVLLEDLTPSIYVGEIVHDASFQSELAEKSIHYRPVLYADYLTGSFEYNTSGYFRSYSTIMGADMMGDYRFRLDFDMSSLSSFDDVNMQIQFAYLKKRTIWSGALFFWKNTYLSRNDWRYDYTEQLAGGAITALYPITQKTALEGAIQVYQKTVTYPYLQNTKRNLAFTAYSGLMHDASKWYGYYHPVSGYKVRIGIEKTFSVVSNSLDYGSYFIDAKKYLKISPRMSIAQRCVYGESWGEDAPLFKIGGINSVRGYSEESLQGTQMLLYNLEIRFPLTDYLQFSLPFGIPPVRGLFFFDMAYTGSGYQTMQLFERKGNKIYFGPNVHGSVGTGVRMYLGGFFHLKFDWAWKTDFANVYTGKDDSTFHFGISQDF